MDTCPRGLSYPRRGSQPSNHTTRVSGGLSVCRWAYSFLGFVGTDRWFQMEETGPRVFSETPGKGWLSEALVLSLGVLATTTQVLGPTN